MHAFNSLLIKQISSKTRPFQCFETYFNDVIKIILSVAVHIYVSYFPHKTVGIHDITAVQVRITTEITLTRQELLHT